MAGDEEGGVRFETAGVSDNFALDLDMTSVLRSETRCLMHAPLSPLVATESGAASLALLASLLDVAASEPALAACRPDWTATQDLTVHAAAPITRGPVVVDVRLVRTGKKAITVVGDFYDAQGEHDFEVLTRGIDTASGLTLAGRGIVTFARIPATSVRGMDDYDPKLWIGQIRRRAPAHPPVGSMRTRMGLSVLDAGAGELELPFTPFVKNGIGTIFGGAQAALLQFAAEAMRPGLTATDLQIHYLSQVKVGPVRTTGRVLRDARDHSVVTLELLDAGNEAQRIALATVLLQR